MTETRWNTLRSHLHWSDALAALIVCVQALGLALISVSGSWYLDDLRAMSQAATYNWSAEWLFGAGVGGSHFSPFTRAWFSALNAIAPMNRPLAVAGVLVLQILASAMLWWFLRRLRVPTVGALLILALYCLSPLGLGPVAWTIQAVQFLPVHVGLLIAAHAQLTYQRTGHIRWIPVALLGLCLGLAAWEKTLPGIVLLLLLAPLWESTRLKALWAWGKSRWLLYVSYAALIACYLAGWRLGGYGTGQSSASSSGIFTTVRVAWTDTIIPGLLGGPWQWRQLSGDTFFPSIVTDIPVRIAAAVVVALVLVWASSRLGWRRVVWTTGAFVLTSTVSVAMAAVGRSSVYGELIGLDPRYTHDVILYAALCAGTALAGATVHSREAARPVRQRVTAGVVGVIALALTINSLVAFTAIWSQNPVGAFLAEAEATVPLAGRPTLDSRVPNSVLDTVLFDTFSYASVVLKPIRPNLPFGRTGPQTGFVDERGRYVSGTYRALATAPRGQIPSCRTNLSTATRLSAEFPLMSPVPHQEGLTVQIDTLAGRSVPWNVEVFDGAQWKQAAPALPANPRQPVPWNAAPAGLVSSNFLLPRTRVTAVRITTSPPGSDVLCVLDVSVGIAAPSAR